MLRIYLPPNLAQSAPKDAIAARIDLQLPPDGQLPAMEWVPILGTFQAILGPSARPTPKTFLQLTRAQLRNLIAAGTNLPAFAWVSTPNSSIPWEGKSLVGVSPLLAPLQEPTQEVPSPTNSVSTGEAPVRTPFGVYRGRGGASPAREDEPVPPVLVSDRPKSGASVSSGAEAAPERGRVPGISGEANTVSRDRRSRSFGSPEPRSNPEARTNASRGADERVAKENSFLKNLVKPGAAQPATSGMTVDGSEHYLAIALPRRDHPAYSTVLDLLKSAGFLAEPANGKWWLRDRHKTLAFLAENGTRLVSDFGATLTPNFLQRTAHIKSAELTAEVTASGANAKDFEVSIGLKAGQASEADLRTAIASSRPYVESAGEIILVGSAQLARLAAAQRALTGDPTAAAAPRQSRRLPSSRAAETEDLLEEFAPGFQSPATWRERSGALKRLSSLPRAPILPSLDAQLRPYQKLGVAWLHHLYRNDLGGILADEMGLGKTLQALALLTALQQQPGSGSALVICPASLLENWRREAARFAPTLRTFVHHGVRRAPDAATLGAYDLTITSYGTLVRDDALFGSVPWGAVIADEAQHVKNRRSQNARALRSLNARGRFLLTGTPLENSLEDLRSLFDFILPGYLSAPLPGARGADKSWYDERLQAQAAPYILRRTKASVAPELPPRIEQVLWCELTDGQAALYRETQESGERALLDLEAGGASDSQVRFAALTQLLRLRQICCDPRLVRPEQSALGSGKLESLRELLEESLDDGHRVLLFSQFTSLLALLRAEFDEQAIPYCYLDGSMPAAARQAEVDRFQGTGAIPLFLLSLKAGGTGLNLTGADTVIHFDPWWNPAAELQATDRAHRIGQTRAVTSYKLIASGTVEERVLGLQAEKRTLLENVFAASDAAAAKLSLGDLKSLLKQ